MFSILLEHSLFLIYICGHFEERESWHLRETFNLTFNVLLILLNEIFEKYTYGRFSLFILGKKKIIIKINKHTLPRLATPQHKSGFIGTNLILAGIGV